MSNIFLPNELIICGNDLDKICTKAGIKCVILRDGSVTIRPHNADETSFVHGRTRSLLVQVGKQRKIIKWVVNERTPKLCFVPKKYEYVNKRIYIGTKFGLPYN